MEGRDPLACPPCPSCARVGDHRGSGVKAAVTEGSIEPLPSVPGVAVLLLQLGSPGTTDPLLLSSFAHRQVLPPEL